jgi:hypothetical protein
LKALKTKVEAQALLKEDRDKEEKAEKELKIILPEQKNTCLINKPGSECAALTKKLKNLDGNFKNA